MNFPSDYRERRDDTDEYLHRIAGLADALDDLLDDVPETWMATRNARMIRSVLASIHYYTQVAQDTHEAEWKALRERTEAEKQAA